MADGSSDATRHGRLVPWSVTKQGDPPPTSHSRPDSYLVQILTISCVPALCGTWFSHGHASNLNAQHLFQVPVLPVRIKTRTVHTPFPITHRLLCRAIHTHPFTHFYALRTHSVTMQSNKVFKDPSPSTAKPPTGRPQTQASSQTSIRTVASSHGAVFF